MLPNYDRQVSITTVVRENLNHLLIDDDDDESINSNQNAYNRFNRKLRTGKKEPADAKTVYVADLHQSDTDKDLVNVFRMIGPVARVSKQADSTYAYLTFERIESAKKALKETVFKLNDHVIRVMPYSQPEVFDPEANLIIKNLEANVNESDLTRKFAGFGNILSCKVVRDGEGRSKCFAYLQFEKVESAKAAIDKLNNTYWNEESDPDKQYEIYKSSIKRLKENSGQSKDVDFQWSKGKKIYVGVFKKREEYVEAKHKKEGKLSNLYVKNLGPTFGDRDLYELFKAYGNIKSAKIRRRKENNEPLGCGFVDFEEPEDAQKALMALDGFILREFENRVLTVKYADCKTRRQKLDHSSTYLIAARESENTSKSSNEELFADHNENNLNFQQIPFIPMMGLPSYSSTTLGLPQFIRDKFENHQANTTYELFPKNSFNNF